MKVTALVAILLASVAVVSANTKSPKPCKEGENYPAVADGECRRYFKCVNGVLVSNVCPKGTLFNGDQDYLFCDAEEHVVCQSVVSEESGRTAYKGGARRGGGKALSGAVKPKLYLTFDDGPSASTGDVLDVLAKYDVKATFFVLTYYISNEVDRYWAKSNKAKLQRVFDEGHDVADHSYDHMTHNAADGRASPYWAYRDVKTDLGYFGEGSTGLFRRMLLDNDVTPAEAKTAADKMRSMVRMPYTNNWRVKYDDGNVYAFDCLECTTPRESGKNGVKLADELFKRGSNVYGWDLEWDTSYETRFASPSAAAAELMSKLQSVHAPGKVVVLTHDWVFVSGFQLDMLAEFIKMAKEANYEFSVLSDFAATA